MEKKIVCYDPLLTPPSPMCIVKLWQLPLKCIADLFFFALHKAYRCSFMVKKIKCISMVFGKGHLLKFVQYWFWKTIRCSAKTKHAVAPTTCIHIQTTRCRANTTEQNTTLRWICAETTASSWMELKHVIGILQWLYHDTILSLNKE